MKEIEKAKIRKKNKKNLESENTKKEAQKVRIQRKKREI